MMGNKIRHEAGSIWHKNTTQQLEQSKIILISCSEEPNFSHDTISSDLDNQDSIKPTEASNPPNTVVAVVVSIIVILALLILLLICFLRNKQFVSLVNLISLFNSSSIVILILCMQLFKIY